MIVMLILGAIAAGFAAAQYSQQSEESSCCDRRLAGGKGPYRSYDAKPTSELYDRLGATVQALRDAATERSWKMNWKKVDQFQQKGGDALEAKRCQGSDPLPGRSDYRNHEPVARTAQPSRQRNRDRLLRVVPTSSGTAPTNSVSTRSARLAIRMWSRPPSIHWCARASPSRTLIARVRFARRADRAS